MEIKICKVCEGNGSIKIQDRNSDIDSVICLKCEGKGRVYARTYELEMSMDKQNEFYKKDEEIVKLIRESKKCQS